MHVYVTSKHILLDGYYFWDKKVFKSKVDAENYADELWKKEKNEMGDESEYSDEVEIDGHNISFHHPVDPFDIDIIVEEIEVL